MSTFNIRVYGLLFSGNKILLSKERYNDLELLKFPGGGLEYGEGTIEGLEREFREELGLQVNDWMHYYTTDFFQKSFVNDQQILSIYYVSNYQLPDKIYPSDTGFAAFFDISPSLIDSISMPIDKIVMQKIIDGNRLF